MVAGCSRRLAVRSFTINLLVTVFLVSFHLGRYAVASSKTVSLANRSLPVLFEANQGQFPRDVIFAAHARNSLLFRRESVELTGGASDKPIRLKFSNTEPNSTVNGEELTPAKSNYFLSDGAVTGVPTYAKVRYNGLYPGLEVTFYSRDRGTIEYDVLVSAGADPKLFVMTIEGADQLSTTGGDLLIQTAGTVLKVSRPHAYQIVEGRQKLVAAEFVLQKNQLRFRLGAYDKSLPLLIDPVLAYSTYFGGSDSDYIVASAVDYQGFVYLAGHTNSIDFQSTPGGFISKLNQNGTGLVYTSYFPANIEAMAVDASGNAFVAGEVFPGSIVVTGGAINTANGYDFIAKISPGGSDLVYAARFGSSDAVDAIRGLAVDSAGNAYVTGWSYGNKYPVTPDAFQTMETQAFVTKFNPAASAMQYSARLGGSDMRNAGGNGTKPYGIAVDQYGQAYVAGFTDARFPTTPNAYQTVRNGQTDIFLTKLSSDGSTLLYSTLIGGSAAEHYVIAGREGAGVAIDELGNAVVTGATYSWNSRILFPTTPDAFRRLPAPAKTIGGLSEAFVAKFDTNSSGKSSLVFSSLLGGIGNDAGRRVTVDDAGNVYVVGVTDSRVFPTTSNALRSCKFSQGHDTFLSALSPDGKALLFSSLLGGLGDEDVVFAGTDRQGNAYVAGTTQSFDFPVTPGVLRPANTAAVVINQDVHRDGFVSKVDARALVSSPPDVVICRPLDGSTLKNGVSVIAGVRDAKPVQSFSIYVDDKNLSEVDRFNTQEATLIISAGQHRLTAKAIRADGTAVSKTVSFSIASNPAPSVGSLLPDKAPIGSPSMTIAVNGTGFVPASVVRWNGLDRPTTFSGTMARVLATIPASDLASAGTAQLSVFTPGPGGGLSNLVPFTIARPPCSASAVNPSVTICSPGNNATMHSPVHIEAVTTDSIPVILMQVYVDGIKKYESGGPTLSADLGMPLGTHRVTVQGRDSSGQVFKSTVYVTINL